MASGGHSFSRKQANKKRNKQANKQTSKQANKQTSKQANKQTSKQANKQTSKQTNKQASKADNKINKQIRKTTNIDQQRSTRIYIWSACCWWSAAAGCHLILAFSILCICDCFLLCISSWYSIQPFFMLPLRRSVYFGNSISHTYIIRHEIMAFSSTNKIPFGFETVRSSLGLLRFGTLAYSEANKIDAWRSQCPRVQS